MTATFGFSFLGLTSGQADAWRAAFSAGQTVYVVMDIGPNGAGGWEWLIVDLRVATASATLSSSKMAVTSGNAAGEGGEPAALAATDEDAGFDCSVPGAGSGRTGVLLATLAGALLLRRRRLGPGR